MLGSACALARVRGDHRNGDDDRHHRERITTVIIRCPHVRRPSVLDVRGAARRGVVC